MEAVWIQYAQSASILAILDVRKHLLAKDLVAVALQHMNVFSRANVSKSTKLTHLVAIQINEVVLIERWLKQERIERAPRYEFAGEFLNMHASASEAVDIDMRQSPLLTENGRVCTGVLPENVEFYL